MSTVSQTRDLAGQALVDELAQRIQLQIMSGELPLGTRLRQETLAEEFGVSRYFVDARVLSIFEGADETLALKVVARRLVEQAG